MTFHLQRDFVLGAALMLLLLHYKAAAENDTTPANSEEEDDSSSEETVEDSNESRRKRSLETSADVDNATRAGGGKIGLPGVPALPDPAVILKIAEILKTVGEKVIPILLEGNPAVGLVAERVNKNLEFLKSFKQEIDTFTDELKLK